MNVSIISTIHSTNATHFDLYGSRQARYARRNCGVQQLWLPTEISLTEPCCVLNRIQLNDVSLLKETVPTVHRVAAND